MTTKVKSDLVKIDQVANPKLHLHGVETNASSLSVRENAGRIEIYDEENGTKATVPVFSDNQGHTNFLSANAIQFPVYVNLQPEGSGTGDASTTGVNYETSAHRKLDLNLLTHAKKAYVEATKSQSQGEIVDVEIYDDDTSTAVTGVTISGSTSFKRGSDLLASLSAGDEVHGRWNVTTSAATGNFTADAVRLSVVAGVS